MNILRPESYLSPFIISYLSKYIKDLASKNLKLSIWGGDAVLHNLQFNLDALDAELGGVPFQFVSCQAQELRIHVPWSKLSSEPVVVTLNTVECVLKLNCVKKAKKEVLKPVQEENTPQVQPSYIENLIKKIKNNISIVVNNFILKYIEDDIVLSVNIQTINYKSCDEAWQESFIEMTEEKPVLRHTCEFGDTTVCLDKRGSNGLVENYEDPLLFRCHIQFRIHTRYPSHLHRKPLAVKINIFMERYELMISEVQLPAFLHLFELCLHIYYKRIEIKTEDNLNQSEEKNESNQGWASWAWSYIPPIINYEEMEAVEVKNSIIAFGLYVKHFIIQFKPSLSSGSQQFHKFRNRGQPSLLNLTAEGVNLEMVARGMDFFSCVTKICKCSAIYEGGLPTSLNGIKLNSNFSETNILLGSAGSSVVGFSADSLFDFRAPENNDTMFKYSMTENEFFGDDTDNSSNAFFSQYLYIAMDGRPDEEKEKMDFSEFLQNVKLTNVNEWDNTQEKSWKKFIIGGDDCQIIISSYSVLCLEILLAWSKNHNHKQYPLVPHKTIKVPKLTKENNNMHFIPSRSTLILLKNLTISVLSLHLQLPTQDETMFYRIDALGTPSTTQLYMHNQNVGVKLPSIVVVVPEATFGILQPMYGSHFSAYLAKFLTPMPRLMSLCNTRYNIDVKAIRLYVWCSDLKHYCSTYVAPNINPFINVHETIFESHSLQGEEFWIKRKTMLKRQTKSTIQSISSNITSFQVEMCLHVLDSWLSLYKSNCNERKVLDLSFLQSKFEDHSWETISINLNNLVFEGNESFNAISMGGALRSINIFRPISEIHLIPLIQCNNTCRPIYVPKEFMDLSKSSFQSMKTMQQTAAWSQDTHWLTSYMFYPFETGCNGCILAHMGQVSVNVDPFVLNFISSVPQIPLHKLLPNVMSGSLFSKTSNDSASVPFKTYSEFRYAVQLNTEGFYIFLPQFSVEIDKHFYNSVPLPHSLRHFIGTKDDDVDLLCICIPQVSAYTAGHKPVQITPALLSHGVTVSNFTEFSTLNIGLEKMSVYTVIGDSTILKALYVIDQCAATCTIVSSTLDKTNAKTNLAVHLDVEPINIKISAVQVKLLVKCLNSILYATENLLINFKSFPKPTVQPVPSVTKETLDHNEEESDNNPAKEQSKHTSVILDSQTPNISILLPFTMWLQCTLPRFSVSMYCATEHNSRLAILIEDISLSLDCQSVYIKLKSCFTSCSATYCIKRNGIWDFGDFDKFLFEPMFSRLPSFVKTYDEPIHKVDLSGDKMDFKKFFDVTFTQALTADYHHQLLDESHDSADLSNSIPTVDKQHNIKKCVNEVICQIQAFDFLIKPQVIIDALEIFYPLKLIEGYQKSNVTQPQESSSPAFDWPALYLNISGIRCFFSTEASGNMLMGCLKKVDVNPHPLNSLPRLVLSPSIYKKAKSLGLLDRVGSALEDKQYELNIQDISIGTCQWSEILTHLKKPAHIENPALQWNSESNWALFSNPIYHPIIQQFDMQATIAPPIWFQSNHNTIAVCAPSLELNLVNEVVCHIAAMHLTVLMDTIKLWSNLNSVNKSKLKEIVMDKKDLIQHDDSGFSVVESSHNSDRRIIPATVGFMGDVLLTGHKFKILFYQYKNLKSKQTEVIPFCNINICDPSLACKISEQQQIVNLQVHDISVNVSDLSIVSETLLQDEASFSTKVFETCSGNFNKRTGVPLSLFTISAENVLTKRAKVKFEIGRPIKFVIHDKLFTIFHQFLSSIKPIFLKDDHASKNPVPKRYNYEKKISSISGETEQIVVDLKTDSCSVRVATSKMILDTLKKQKTQQYNLQLKDCTLRVQLSEDNFLPCLLPMTLKLTLCSSSIPKSCRNKLNLDVKISFVQVFLSKTFVSGITQLLNCYQQNLNEIRSSFLTTTEKSASPDLDLLPSVYSTLNLDSLRTSTYSYISSNNVKPHANQIVFSDDAMSWCYSNPCAVKHVRITPIPFIETDVYQTGIQCFLEVHDVSENKYKIVKQFTLSETKFVDLKIFDDDTPLPLIKVSSIWRVRLLNTEYCKISSKSLALAMQVDSLYDTNLFPSIIADINVENFVASYIIKQKTSNVETARINFDRIHLDGIVWDSNVEAVANCDFKWSLDMIEFHNLTWVPFVLPTELKINAQHNLNGFKLNLESKEEIEIHAGGRTIHSLDYLLNNIVSPKKTTSYTPCIEVKNCTSTTLLFGQALTDECIILQPSETCSYSWRSNKVDIKLHISAQEKLQLNWSEAFSVQETQTFRSHVEGSGIVVSIKSNNSWRKEVTFYGETRFANHLPFDIDLLLTTNKGNVVLPCPTYSKTVLDYSSNISNILMIALKISNDDADFCEPISVTDFTAFTEDTKIIQFNSKTEEKTYCQLCYYKDNLTDVITILPVFMICSYLPFTSILHVETRSLKVTKSTLLLGYGKTMPLLHLSPFLKHHLTIQLNEDQSPFDATLPIHFSLTNTMVDSSSLSEAPIDFSKHYPYNQMETTGNYDEIWSPEDGKIQAKLSMYQRSLFIEITSWCLISNKLEISLCFSSQDESTVIVQPNQVVVPHLFQGPFHIRTSNSLPSDWLSLSKPGKFNHPSRPQVLLPSHIPYNGLQNIVLTNNLANLDLNIRSTVCHGIRILTVSSRWWFVNLSSVDHILVTPFEYLEEDFTNNTNNAIDVKTTSPIPLLQWFSVDNIEAEGLNNPTAGPGNVATSSNESTSSFVCVDSDVTKTVTSLSMPNRVLLFQATNCFAKIAIEGDFTRKLVQFHQPDNAIQKVLLLTKHEHPDGMYLVLNDVKRPKYQIINQTSIELQICEPEKSDLYIIVPANDKVFYESYSSLLDFPRCTRKHVSINLEICDEDNVNRTNVEIFSKQYIGKITLGTMEFYLRIVLKNSYTMIFIAEQLQFEEQAISINDSYQFAGTFKAIKFVVFDDLSHPLYNRDIMHCFMDNVQVKFNNSNENSNWLAELSIKNIQCDNHFQLYPDFPVFLYTPSTKDLPILLSVVFTQNFVLDSVNAQLKPIELKIENDFAQVLAKVLQSYLETIATDGRSKEKEFNSVLSTEIIDAAKSISDPLRFQHFIIEPVDLLVSFRTEMKLHFSVDRGSIKFSKFACRDLDTTVQEIVQEIVRHYVADAVYGAGWVIGSLDLLGNPATTLRSYAQGISDFLLLPYEGLKVGPKAFVGGVTRGVSSLLLHLSSGTLRSFTNIASSISRNFSDNRKQPIEREELRSMLLSTENKTPKTEHGYVAGVGKTLAGIVTKPIGGAASIVSRAGETILRKVGLEAHISPKNISLSHAVSDYENSATKYAVKMFPESALTPFDVFSLPAQMLSSGGFNFDVVLVLSPENLYVIRSEDDSIDCVIPVTDINISLKSSSNDSAILTIQQINQPGKIKDTDYSEKVADYLGVSPTENLIPDENDYAKYTAQVDNLLNAQLFLSLFNTVKPMENKFQW